MNKNRFIFTPNKSYFLENHVPGHVMVNNHPNVVFGSYHSLHYDDVHMTIHTQGTVATKLVAD